MKKIKFGSIEVLGYIGIFIWLAVLFLRENNLSNNELFLFLLGILPNLGAAWVFTMFFKFAVIFLYKQEYTIKLHLISCLGVVFLAFMSEIIHHYFLNSPFDIWDMFITLLAQMSIFPIPLLTKDKYFNNYY